ncbi:hypothetical protein COMA2_20183 [Candidatus Nitrospira nitrificans]|uniref:Secreted protein n=1 Tax=Candidatus Nitrospira nitrificans TaxID=1742973 RepID=A0A0S4LDI8_9BACT|nr:hypothetical protein COMA2_20183 [Candidatus Nitrospira nitrificans]
MSRRNCAIQTILLFWHVPWPATLSTSSQAIMIFSTCTRSKECRLFGLPCFFSFFIRRHKLLTAPAQEPPSCLTSSLDLQEVLTIITQRLATLFFHALRLTFYGLNLLFHDIHVDRPRRGGKADHENRQQRAHVGHVHFHCTLLSSG